MLTVTLLMVAVGVPAAGIVTACAVAWVVGQGLRAMGYECSWVEEIWR